MGSAQRCFTSAAGVGGSCGRLDSALGAFGLAGRTRRDASARGGDCAATLAGSAAAGLGAAGALRVVLAAGALAACAHPSAHQVSEDK